MAAMRGKKSGNSSSLYLDVIFNEHILYVRHTERIKVEGKADCAVPKLRT